MLHTLDSEESLSVSAVGAKAAWLARGRRAGLPVLPGVVVSADESVAAMNLAAGTLESRGSGRARMTITQGSIPETAEGVLIEEAGRLGDVLVVRSSSVLEGAGEWSGAFTSYLDARPDEVPRAVKGCWASAFTVDALGRYDAMGIRPGSAPMGVLVQRALEPNFGGVARIVDGNGVVEVAAVVGSPAPLVQGWEPGVHAKVSPDGVVTGERGDIPEQVIADVAQLLRDADAAVGANGCEWAVEGSQVLLLQLSRESRVVDDPERALDGYRDPGLVAVARVVRRFPGPLGEQLVLGWALADPGSYLDVQGSIDVDPVEALIEAKAHANTLMAETWGSIKSDANEAAVRAFRLLRSDDPAAGLAMLDGLRKPDPERSLLTLRLIRTALGALAAQGAVPFPESGWHVRYDDALKALRSGAPEALAPRIGFDRWQPFDTSVIMAHGSAAKATPAAPGFAAGRMCFMPDPRDMEHFRPRDVIVGTHPIPNYAPLLFDASALVTLGGGPGAHLFESARALAIPAVCGVNLADLLGRDPSDPWPAFSLAVDGFEGRLFAQER